MRELRLKYIINMVSDIGRTAKSDEATLTKAQKQIAEALQKTNTELGLMERLLLRVGRVHTQSAEVQANYLARLALRYQDVRKHAEAAANAMQRVYRVGAGAAAGTYVADSMMRAPMDYSLRLAHMANTAYADRDVRGRIAGKQMLNSAIQSAVRVGGGSRDDAANALDALIASGALSPQEAMRVLPGLMRGSTASGAPATELANIALRGKQTFGIGIDQMPEVLNMAMAAGQAGGFELKDMAKWLPQAMASGRQVGMGGMEGMRRILASLQAGVIVAGTKDEAGNNLINLLNKVNSEDTAKDFAKVGIDLRKELMKGQASGVNGLDTFLGLVDRVTAGVRKDPAYAKLAGQAAKGDEMAATGFQQLLQGTAISKVVQDRQALMALLAELNNRGYVQQVMDTTRTNRGALDTSFGVIGQEAEFSRQQALNEAAFGAQRAFDTAAPALTKVADTATAAARAFPNLTAAVATATGVFIAAGTALGAAGLVGMLTGRAGNAGGLITTAGGFAAGAATGLWSRAGWAVRAGGAVLGPALAGGMDAYSAATDPNLTPEQRRMAYAAAGAGTVGGIGLATAGAALGTAFFPGVGTLIGGAAGGLAGYLGGKKGLEWIWGQDPGAGLNGADGGGMLPTGRLELGQGKVQVDVKVSDDRVTWEMASQSSPGLLLSPGPTNPGGYGVTTR